MEIATFPGQTGTKEYSAEITYTCGIRGVQVSILKLDEDPVDFDCYYLVREFQEGDDQLWKIVFDGVEYYVISNSDGYASVVAQEFALEELEVLRAGTYAWQVEELIGKRASA